MNRSCSRFFQLGLPFLLLITFSNRSWGAEPRVQIRSPKDGSHITREQEYVLVSGKVASESARSPDVDIFLVLAVSLSTAQYAGVDFSMCIHDGSRECMVPGAPFDRGHIICVFRSSPRKSSRPVAYCPSLIQKRRASA
jgi:hypothetical protein